MDAYIAGIDPGTNFAIVVINEDGYIVDKMSGKNLEDKDIIQYINKLNNVIIISTDKKDIPKKIIEIASKLNIGIYYPKKDIDLITKKKYYEDNKLKNVLESDHEFDAYISAMEALKNIKGIIEKAKKVAESDDEYIKILRISFKNRNIEPVSAKEKIKDNESKNIVYKKRKKVRKIINNYDSIKILTKKYIIKKDEEEIKALNKKYIDSLNYINKLSLELLNRLRINDNIIPKASFLYNNNISYNKVYIDIYDTDISKILSSKSMIYIEEPKKEYISKYNYNSIYIVKNFEDLRNFVLIKEYYKYDITDVKENDDIEKIKKFIKLYRSTPNSN
ncbi:hypothetical protein MJ1_0782 [Nanobdella aerobiophila]|uniref:DUF460 domain-containing protein n=1 Tax=Nanobdella aerobiophila TaxID=2586965 RepID=A0A915SIV8_9ARCH|nr:DUF460 domain-containing protein [Nanobdella aerobiophila]BBL45917.1 hypothetical protein MJ1_0782 [Nanobdella aerobiophila]